MHALKRPSLLPGLLLQCIGDSVGPHADNLETCRQLPWLRSECRRSWLISDSQKVQCQCCHYAHLKYALTHLLLSVEQLPVAHSLHWQAQLKIRLNGVHLLQRIVRLQLESQIRDRSNSNEHPAVPLQRRSVPLIATNLPSQLILNLQSLRRQLMENHLRVMWPKKNDFYLPLLLLFHQH